MIMTTTATRRRVTIIVTVTVIWTIIMTVTIIINK
jgi:hypothetical protein